MRFSFFFSVCACVLCARDILRPWFVLGTRELTIVKKKGKIYGNPVKVTKNVAINQFVFVTTATRTHTHILVYSHEFGAKVINIQ